MATRPTQHRTTQGMSRRQLLQTGLAAGATLATWPLYHSDAVWGAEAGAPKRGGILRARGWDPVHFDPHVTRNFKTHTALSFVYSKLLRHKVGPDVPPGTFIVEPDLAERWESPDDTTYIFHLRQGVKWHNKPPVNGRELVAEDVKFSFDRFLTRRRQSRAAVAGVRGPGGGGGPLYREVYPQRAVRLVARHPGQRHVHVDRRPRSGHSNMAT